MAVVGYPARAPAHIIPDQAWMDRIYGGTYDVKRIAPGLLGEASRGWATHDCTTLGGNSGSVVLDMKTGRAVALHFAGLYMVENYAVPASTVRQYLKDRPWHGGAPSTRPRRRPAPPEAPAARKTTVAPASVETDNGTVSITIPLVDQRVARRAAADGGCRNGYARSGTEAAADALLQEQRGKACWMPGPATPSRRAIDRRDCLVVSAHPDRVADVRARMPASSPGFRSMSGRHRWKTQLMVSAPELR